MFHLRLADMNDEQDIRELMNTSILELQKNYLTN